MSFLFTHAIIVSCTHPLSLVHTRAAEAPQAVCEKLREQGHIERWQGRFGSLRADTGVFTLKQNQATTSSSSTRMDEEERVDGEEQSEDFFRLLAPESVVYAGTPSMKGLCEVRGGAGLKTGLNNNRHARQ